MAETAVSAALVLAQEVFSFLSREAYLQKSLQGDVNDIRNFLKRAKAYLKDMGGKEGGEVFKERMREIRDLAYDTEDVLDEFKLHVPQLYKHKYTKSLRESLHYIKHCPALNEISSKVKGIKRRMDNIVKLDHVVSFSPEEGSSSGTRMEDQTFQYVSKEDDILGYEQHQKTLLHHLVEGDSTSKTIWVVGPGGSGKTILVKTVCERKEVLGRYDSQAWIHVSRSFKKDELLSSMLNQFVEGSDKSISLSRENVGAKVRAYLPGKKYLLVLDDIWSKEDWDCIVNALPQVYGGSRIIATTRKKDVASSSCVESPGHILELKGLHWPYNWSLFCKKAFQSSEGRCPKELENWSQMILKKCEGLPLAIAAIGSFLATKQKNPNEWKTLHDSLGSEIASDSSLAIISKVLLPSYKDLSDNLKSCFLYFSIFPEDYSVKRGRLIRLWQSEGFIEKRGGKTLEQVAEDSLNELIVRNLVHVSAWDADGRVRSCLVLNLVREFTILKSKEENFVTILEEPGTSSSEKIGRRLCINHPCTSVSDIGDLGCVRAFLMFKWDNHIRKLFPDLKRMRFLRVLDLQGAPLDNFPKEIVELTLLKCLSLKETNIKKVPKSIKKLAYLETLDLRQTYVTELPSEILLLQYLHHLLVYRYDVKKYVLFDSAKGVEIFIPKHIEHFSSIQKLSLIKANMDRVVKQLKKMNQLRKLGMIDLKREDGKALCESIQSMENLLTLDIRSACQDEYLDLNDMGNPPFLLRRLYLKGLLYNFPVWISSHHSLVRIGLKWSRLKNSPLEALQDLPNLVELEMVDSFTGEKLEFNAGKFKKLKILHLEQFDELNTVTVEQNAMPELSKLTMCKCNKLEMLPSGINNLTKLEELLVHDMHHNFIASLQKNSEHRNMVEHIRIIHCFTLDNEMSESWSFKNLS